MKNVKKIFRINFIILLVLALLPIANAEANNGANKKTLTKRAAKAQNLIAADLSKKLKADLAENNLSIKLKNFEELGASGGIVEIKGEAFCVFMKDRAALPLAFEAKFDTSKQAVSDVQYVFIENAESESAPSTQEEVLMKTLMTQISADYKTEQVTIAIDNYEALQSNANKTEFQGMGEVKIGQFVWNKINFSVVMNSEKNASEIKYEIK